MMLEKNYVRSNAMMTRPLSRHLSNLETEAIVILREAAASFERPVLMYSIGKDSSVLLHLCRKAFHPAKIPFAALHIDTTWKFRDMITFRDRMAAELDLNLIVHTNQKGDRRRRASDRLGIGGLYPRDEDGGVARSARHASVRRCHRRRAPRRGAEPLQGTHLLGARSQSFLGSAPAAAGTLASLQPADRARRNHAGVSALELDRARRVGIHPGRRHSRGAALFREGAAGGGTRRQPDHGR